MEVFILLINVLIAEDEKSVRQNISGFIKDQGNHFRLIGSASNGVEALEFFREQPIHILLTDIRMPKMDGFELIESIYEEWPETKTIILSGYDDFAYARRAMQYGVTDYLLKPIIREELNMALVKILSSLSNATKYLSVFVNQEKWDMRLIRLEAKLLGAVEIGHTTAADAALTDLFKGFHQRVADDHLKLIPFIIDTLTSLRKRLSSIDTVQLYFDQELKLLSKVFEKHYSLDEIKLNVKEFILFCANTVKMCRQQSCPDILFHCKEILKSQYKQEVTLTSLASIVGVTPAYLSRLFKKELGINFIDYLNQIRITKAKELLDVPNIKVLEVASIVGFNNPEYFTKTFKKFTGMTPQNYRLKRLKEA